MLTTNLNIRCRPQEKEEFDSVCHAVNAQPSEVLRSLMKLVVRQGLQWSPDGHIQLKESDRA
jgi:hypothetical protein